MLGNSGDEIVLDNGVEDLDEVVYDGTWGVSSGYAFELDPTATDATLNDDFANWCEATVGYGTAANYGTPGAVNESCF
jgi:hypothetical protein